MSERRLLDAFGPLARQAFQRAETVGYITTAELGAVLPERPDTDLLEDVLAFLAEEMGVHLVESDDTSEADSSPNR